MCQDKIYFIIMFCQILYTLIHLFFIWHFSLPP